MEHEWTTEWPTAPGLYWFYGWTFTKDYTTLPKYHPGLVRMVGAGNLLYLLDGAFAFKGENNHRGKWHLAELPPCPDLTDL